MLLFFCIFFPLILSQSSCIAAGAANEVNYICSDYISRSAAVLLQSAADLLQASIIAAAVQPRQQMRVITIQLQ